MAMNSGRTVAGLALIVGIAVAGIAVGYGFGASLFSAPVASTVTVTASSTSTTTGPSSTFDLTLVITTGNTFNSSVGAQPAYYVLGPKGLESAANLALPAHQLIKLTIICYDDGAANLTGSQYATVAGTQNNTVSEVSNDNVNSSQGASGIQVTGGQTVTSLNASDVAHTFTIPSLGLNIPIAPSSTVVAYFTINQTGTFMWFCQTECGYGPGGLLGAMASPGWMYGQVVAS